MELYYGNAYLNTPEMKKQRAFLLDIISPADRPIIDIVIRKYGSMAGAELMDMTRGYGTPWSGYYAKDATGMVISESCIWEHYLQIYNERQ